MLRLLSALALTSLVSSAALAQTAATSGKRVNIGDPLALTFYISPAHPVAAEAKARSLQTPGSSDFHQFLTLDQFVENYAVSDSTLKNIENKLQALGFVIGYVFPNHLAIQVTGTVGTANSALGINLQEVTRNGKTGMAPDRPILLPPSLQGSVRGVGGLNTIALARPLHRPAPSVNPDITTRPDASGPLVGGTPGHYLPADFAQFYNVNPLYNRGFTGRGATIGIVTLNNFKPKDAYTFWQGIGLSVSPTRITKVSVDGGVTATSNNKDGEGETDLDVEYSGALAPAANLRVYIAPNLTNSNFLDGFEAAASENIADTLSTSWGQAELDFFTDVDPTDPSPSETYVLDEFHDVFLEMAIQGQSLFAAAGDSGSFDTVAECPVFGKPTKKMPTCNSPYAVDHPSSDPLVTAAGGTTLPFTVTTSHGLTITVKQERAWGWDYIVNQAANQGLSSIYPLSDFFSVGGGGGVSSYFALPWYQVGTPGLTRTVPNQFLAEDFGSGSNLAVTLPSNFAGRNTPDLSTNADPESGYQYVQDGKVADFYGGTSFVAPQLNGVNALFVQAFGRVGSVNPVLYAVPRSTFGSISAGDNWGYLANPGYDNAAGLGTLNAEQLFLNVQTLTTSK